MPIEAATLADALICSRCKLIVDWEYGRAALDPV